MAKTYLQVHSEANILVVEKAHSIGGSWATERLYPRLKTNNLFGSYEWSDLPMVPERYGATSGGHIPGRVVHEYFCDAAAHFGIDSCVQLGTMVESATLREDGRWTIKLQSVEHGPNPTSAVVADKLVVATGLTSEPHIPMIPGEVDFGGLILHSKHLKDQAAEIASCKNIVVLGGNKSAWDVCYDAAQSGGRVHMVIRPSGGGPSYLWPRSFTYGPFTLSLAALSATRLFLPFDPTPFGKIGLFSWWSRFLHRTMVGGKICQYFWKTLDLLIKKLNGYNSHPELRKLEPWTTPFWMGNSLSIHNYDTSWFDLVRAGNISIHVSDVLSLSTDRVNLSNGEILKADVLVCCTGWNTEPPIRFYPGDIAASLGLRGSSEEANEDVGRAEQEIHHEIQYLRTLPRRTPNAPTPMGGSPKPTSRSVQLYRLVVPSQPLFLERRNVAFIGLHSSIHAMVVAQAQALWITAFFQERVKHLTASRIDLDAVRYSSIFHSVYGRIRRPRECGGAGDKYPDLVFDSIPYVDCLLTDLGLESRRKRRWWKEVFERYLPRDYQGLVEEWRREGQNGSEEKNRSSW